MIKKLFLSYYSKHEHEVRTLARELRLRGIVPWVDKDGGFQIGDDAEDEARRAIREDCFGLLLYATIDVFDRQFIREIEVPEAIAARSRDPSFVLFAVPCGINFSDLKQHSESRFGFDLSRFHTTAITQAASIDVVASTVAASVVEKTLHRAARSREFSRLSFQFSTWDVLADQEDDVLRIDARALYNGSIDPASRVPILCASLSDIKKGITEAFGRPRLLVGGSKHLTAAFVFGFVFSPFEMDIWQTPEQIWGTDTPACSSSHLSQNVIQSGRKTGRLFVEIASRNKNVPAGVDTFITRSQVYPSVRLQMLPNVRDLNVDNGICRAMASNVYSAVEAVAQRQSVNEIHIFAAVPQSLMIMLGRLWKGMPKTFLYEWTGGAYVTAGWVN